MQELMGLRQSTKQANNYYAKFYSTASFVWVAGASIDSIDIGFDHSFIFFLS